jgi:mannan endo-1,4-beta-mannosidase
VTLLRWLVLLAAFVTIALLIGRWSLGLGSDGSGSDKTGSERRLSANPDHPKKVRPIEGKVMIGAFDPQEKNGQTAFEKVLGEEVAVISVYQSWGGDPEFKRDWAEAVAARGKVPMITWEPWLPSTTDFDQPDYRLRAIADGNHDQYLRRWFTDVGEWDGPILVRFAHEMNGHWYPWGMHVNTRRDYIDAWRHVVDVSREAGADNITWVWSPNETSERNLKDFYPGDGYVDWTGLSGFNWGGKALGDNVTVWRGFGEIYDSPLEQLKAFNKPIMIAEIGSIENDVAGNHSEQTKAEWIEEAFGELKRRRVDIGLVIWFDDIFMDTYDWRVSTSPESADAMKSALSDPVFQGRLKPSR